MAVRGFRIRPILIDLVDCLHECPYGPGKLEWAIATPQNHEMNHHGSGLALFSVATNSVQRNRYGMSVTSRTSSQH